MSEYKRAWYISIFPIALFITQAVDLSYALGDWQGLFYYFQGLRCFENHLVPFPCFIDGEGKAQGDKINPVEVIEEEERIV